MKRSLLGLVLVLAASAMIAGSAAAQVSDNIQVTGTVAGPLSVTRGNDLNFGVIIPDLARTILPSDPGAGTFTVNGQSGAGVQLTFPGLPTVITGLGADIPVTYNLVYSTANDPNSGSSINPAVVINPTTTLSAAGELFVFLGGSLTAAADQAPGTYSGTFTLQAAYVNN